MVLKKIKQYNLTDKLINELNDIGLKLSDISFKDESSKELVNLSNNNLNISNLNEKNLKKGNVNENKSNIFFNKKRTKIRG